jgi:MerR-like DNA binding protein
MRIGEMVRRTGVNERLLRYYEEQGLLQPARLPQGYRAYRETDVDAVPYPLPAHRGADHVDDRPDLAVHPR